MSLFHSILSQVQEKIKKETLVNETIASIISPVIGTTITKDQVMIKGTTLRIKSAPTLKMAISLKREKILSALKEAGQSINTIE